MEHIGAIFSSIGSFLVKAIGWLLKFSIFIIFSILVLPAMFIMLFLQEPWEKMLDEITSI